MQQASGQKISIDQALQTCMQQINAGQLGAAQSLLNQVLNQKPSQPDARHLLGVIYLMQGNAGPAEKEIRKSLQKNPKFAMAHFNLGNALFQQDKPDQAILSFKKALQLQPGYVQAQRRLADALFVAEKFDEAEVQYRSLLDQTPTDLSLMVTFADMLDTQGKWDGAIELFNQAIEIKGDECLIYVKLANTLNQAGRSVEAEKVILKALELNPSFHSAHMAHSYIMLSQGKAEEGLAAANRALEIFPGETTAVAWKMTALDQLGGGDEYDRYMDFDEFVRPESTPVPDGYKSQDVFNEALVKHVVNHPKIFSFEHYEVTRHGQEIKDIFSEPMGPVAHLKAAMEKRVADYINNLPDDPDNQFVQTAPKKWRIKSWANLLKGEGRQIAHMHGEAWLSGCYYVRLPDVMKANENPDKQGWIEFGQINDEFPNLTTERLQFVKPEEGMMVLFPSYLYHSTVPTKSKQPRIAIAFDVVPVK